ncbi:YchJ family protein [Shewanella xiamenensis]|uniref:YchJ family protein n=1 Tax=Shewanella TaxID=22 RepID=UPI00264758CC|nr:YchJ family metal-binding protein [Shewanella sp.]MDN5500829.1 SEC-C domain-containing protein [Shewanella sp.]MDN5529285.1 SEC-C domain-containing protein [Shewanella sp.]
MIPEAYCPCCSQKPYQHCCETLHLNVDSGTQVATSPEQLMRSRYCAFVLKNFDYIIKTHHVDFLDGLTFEQLQQGPHPHWLGLEVLAANEKIYPDGTQRGNVTFKAWYKLAGEIDAIYERSEFIFEQGRWYYTQGQQMQAKRPGRNDPCVCQSGKKFKQCCLTR